MSASEPTCLHDWRAANWIMIVATATESTVGANHDIMSRSSVVRNIMEPTVQLLGLDHVDKCMLIDPTDHRYELTLRFRVDDGVDEGFLLLLVTSDTLEQSSVMVSQVADGVVDLI